MRPFETLRAALGDLRYFAHDEQLSRLRHGQGQLVVAGHLIAFDHTERFAVPGARQVEIGHFYTYVADAAQRNGCLLWRQIRRLFAKTKLYGVAVGIEDEQRLFDRTRRRIIDDVLPAQLLLRGFLRSRRKIIGSDLETPHDTFQSARRGRRQTEILQSEAKAGVIRHGEEDDHRHFAVKTARVQVGVKAEPRAHEGRPEKKSAAEIVGRQNAVVDAF